MYYLPNNRLAVLLFLMLINHWAAAQNPATTGLDSRDDVWRGKELSRAKRLIYELQDFSPVHEAFQAQDVVLLWHYYIRSFEIPMHRFHGWGPRVSEEILPTLPSERQQMIKIHRKLRPLAQDFLLRTPGHARYLGDRIEEQMRNDSDQVPRTVLFSCLGALAVDGSDECIAQLGRFLFDKRDPEFRPFDPAKDVRGMYDIRGTRNPVQNNAIGWLRSVLETRFNINHPLLDENGLPCKGIEEKVQAWWLNSAEAAPYRRSLAATGVVLPPGYPAMKELEGTQTKIAPPLRNPPYPNEESPPAPPSSVNQH